MAGDSGTQIEKLCAALAALVTAARGVGTADSAIAGKMQSRFPRPTDEEIALAHSDDPLVGDQALNGAWSNILRRTKYTLVGFWIAWQSARIAFQDLPKDQFDDLTKPLPDRWSTKVSRLLNDLAGAVHETQPHDDIVPLWPMMTYRLPGNWQNWIDALADYFHELAAIVDASGPPLPIPSNNEIEKPIAVKVATNTAESETAIRNEIGEQSGPLPVHASLRLEYQDPDNYWRNVWLYELKKGGKTNETILAELGKRAKEFATLESQNALRSALESIAQFHNWPVLQGKPGRPKKM